MLLRFRVILGLERSDAVDTVEYRARLLLELVEIGIRHPLRFRHGLHSLQSAFSVLCAFSQVLLRILVGLRGRSLGISQQCERSKIVRTRLQHPLRSVRHLSGIVGLLVRAH